ncbi:MAG TPA: uracil-DNA glycosylase [Mycobacteriales bacterium]|nr:uracil-DNA glycosylase [Mycobacteriales bacterium]
MVAEPGSGWTGDLASATTPVAETSAEVVRLAETSTSIGELSARVTVCRACPRLVAWREEVARTGRAAYAGQAYWGRPVSGFGPADARVAIVGLAPAAHGGNRTGRVFTGDRSGDWLFAALHRAGFARLPVSVDADDGQELIDVRMVAAVRCAPPANVPTTGERDTCRPWLERELALLQPTLRVVVALGGFAWSVVWPVLATLGHTPPRPRPKFGHLVEAVTPEGLLVLASFHPSQQNTFTGRLTEPMLDAVFARAAARLAGE